MIALETSFKSKLRFAALRRVSTEQQEKTGESLRTQKTDIEKYVEQLGGEIIAWYGGQEHATPGYEKKEIDRLLNDTLKKKFDAVIVTDADRWSRDNSKSKAGLDIFKGNGIRFFVGTKEWDLYKPEDCLFLGMSAVMGEFFASNQKRKSLRSRIHRANRGCPTCGKLPYGRTFDKKTEKWGIDKKKQAIIETAAKRYLAGEKLPELAEEFGMNASNLHKILTKRSGSLWETEFNSDKLNIHEKVEIKIPPLLPDSIITAIIKKADANRTYLHAHGKAKNQYLLGRMVFCKHCEYAMFGQTNHNGHRYYRHAHTKRERECNQQKTWVNAEELEDIVMRHLFECFGNPKAVERAIEKAIPNLEKVREYQKQLEHIEEELKKIKSGRERIIRLVANCSITERDATNQLDEIKQRENSLQTKQQQIKDSLGNRPDPDKVKAVSKKISSQFNSYSLRLNTVRRIASNKPYSKMTYDEKRALVELVFSSRTPEGKRMGWTDKGWKFDIHGLLIDKQGLNPSTDYLKQHTYFEGEFGEKRELPEFYHTGKQRELLTITKYALY
ncbi:MAG: recombinase family protein [Sedimentisphaerales bacterium]